MTNSIYTLTNHSIEADVYGENRTESVYLIHFFQKNHRGIEKEHSFKKEVEKASKIVNSNHKPHYVTKSFQDGYIYQFHNQGVFDSNLSMGKFCGKIMQTDDSYIIFLIKEAETFTDFCNRVERIISDELN